jgi:hypothetical protein
VSALHFGPLALVQPILALELLFVFAYMALSGRSPVTVRPRDWLAAVAMSAGIGTFLGVASPSRGRLDVPASMWWPASLVTLGLVVLALTVTYGPFRRHVASRPRRAAVLGAATGISWGFVAAVIKELSSQLGEGINAVTTSWPLYVLIVAGAATLVLASHALAVGPLAASQPGFTILDPLWASLLGMFLFDEHVRTGGLDLFFEALALAVVIGGVAALSHSHLIADEDGPPSGGREGYLPTDDGNGSACDGQPGAWDTWHGGRRVSIWRRPLRSGSEGRPENGPAMTTGSDRHDAVPARTLQGR